MPVTQYWFARRFPLGDHRSAMAPIHWKGWAATGVFVFFLILGALAFAWMGADGQMVKGVVTFMAAAAIGAVWFIGVSQRKGDPVRTVADYKKDAARV